MIDQYPPANGVLTSLIWRKTMSGGETSLSGYDNASQSLSYTPGQEQVYLNGILLVRGDDYTATNGTSITGLSALAANDFVQVNCYNNFSVASVPTTSLTGEVTNSQITSLATSKLTGTIANNQLANSSITINGNAVSLGGSVSLPGDIESVTASSPLTGGGTSGAVTIGIQSASTTQSGAVQLTDSTSSTSTTTAATPNAVKSAYDLANGAIQKTLTTTTGDIIYASSANTPARLGIGSTGNILTVSDGVPAWSAPAASGGFTLIQRYVPNNSQVQLAFTSINSIYKHLLLVWTGINTNGDFVIRLNNDSGSNYSHDSVSGDTSLGSRSFTATANQGANEHSAHGYAWIFDANSTSYWKQYVTEKANYSNTYGWQDTHYQGMWRDTSAVSSIYIVCDNSTTLTAVTGGSVALYGVS